MEEIKLSGKNKLPKYWVVQCPSEEQEIELFRNTVIRYIREVIGEKWKGDAIGYYYGYDGRDDFNGTVCSYNLSNFKNNPTLLTLQQFINCFKKEVMTKQMFTVGGSLSLRQKFVAKLGIPTINGGTISDKYPYLAPSVLDKGYIQGYKKRELVHFDLPKDYADALAYARNYFRIKNPKAGKSFEIGDIVVIDNLTPTEKSGYVDGVVGHIGIITNISGEGWHTLTPYCMGGCWQASHLRYATEKEITKFNNKTLKFGQDTVFFRRGEDFVTIPEGKITKDEIKKVVDTFEPSISILGYDLRVEGTVNIAFGCKKGTLAEAKAILEAFDE